jgi:hypothetical protein
MNRLEAQREYEQAAELRHGAFELLDRHMRASPDERDPRVIVELQDAANHLGAVERSLRDGARPQPLVPAAGPRAASQASSDPASTPPERPKTASAAIYLALAETLVPFAASRADEAERWLRIMREHGKVGEALANLGMVSGQFSTPSMGSASRQPDPTSVTAVVSDAASFADERGAPAIGGVDVLFAVILQYGSLFDRALYGATNKRRQDLLAALGRQDADAPVASCQDRARATAPSNTSSHRSTAESIV